MRLRRFLKPLLIVALGVVVIFCAIAYRWVSHHIYFSIDHSQILVDGAWNPMLYDYMPGKSLNGDIFLRNMDHGTEYLISPKKKEVSTISEDYDFIDIDFFTYTRDDLVNYKYSKVKKTVLPNSNLIVGSGFVEFTSSEGKRWHVTY
jgi:hypothetical protein